MIKTVDLNLWPYTPIIQINMADHSVSAPDELRKSEASQA